MRRHFQIATRPGVRQAAFFDLEKTLTPHAVEQELAVAFAACGALEWSALARVLYVYAQYNLGLISDFDQMKRFGAQVFTGREHEPDARLVRTLFELRLERFIFPQARALVRQLKDLGFELHLVSSTYRFMAEPYARALGIEQVHAVDLELEAGRCTGRISGTIFHQQHKAQVAREAEARGVSLADSYAFGDSLNDLPLLEAVGHPVPVNPARGLARIAAQRGWQPVRWSLDD
jgi:HAD superfamily hydrolase (TIGR01490 family)